MSFFVFPELSTSSGRNGGATVLDGKAKLDLVELVAPVAEDLRLLNDNLQKVLSRNLYFNELLLARRCSSNIDRLVGSDCRC